MGNCLIETANKTLVLGCKNSVIPTDGSVTSISRSAFYGCTGLTSITIPNSITSIGSHAFYKCTNLTSITFDGTVEQWNAISKDSDWDSYTGNYIIYCTDGEIAKDGTITCYHNYTSIITPPTATENGYTTYTCSSCSDTYTEEIVPTDFTVTSSNRALVGYKGTENENLVIPAVFEDNGTWYRVTMIGSNAFENCLELMSITIPDSVMRIGSRAFYGCNSLTSIDFEDTSTWYETTNFSNLSFMTGGTTISVINASTNATYFKSTYIVCYWYKK